MCGILESMDSQSFRIKTNTFEGPLELLLDLIEKRKLFINEISLSQVTDDYIAYIKTLTGESIGSIAQFISIATTLLLIKSRSLLPNLSLSEEEETDIDTLEKRVALYQVFRDAGKHIMSMLGKTPLFARPFKKIKVVAFSPGEGLTKEIILSSLLESIAQVPVPKKREEVSVKKVINIQEVIENLTNRIQKEMQFSFSSFTGGRSSKIQSKEDRVYVIVSFLAMLELIRNGLLDALQDDHFSDITITKQETTLYEPTN